jgi:Lon protease-like protein
VRLPLFPLNTVLLPNTTLPLHIFEERYKTMINRCIEERAPFGVVLIRSGEEVGGDAEPYEIGCTARIVQIDRRPDGRMNLLTFGDDRFRILSLDRSAPYLQGDVELLASTDVEAPEVTDLTARVVALFREHFRLVLALTGQWLREFDLPKEPEVLADFLAGNLELPVEKKQELLETLSVPVRLERLTGILGERIRVLSERWEEKRRKQFGRGVLN